MNTVFVYYIKHTEKLEKVLFEKYLQLLPAAFREEIRQYKHWESAQASLLGKILLHYACNDTGIPDALRQLQNGVKDRPFINDVIDFNISHSGEYVVVAITHHGKVGIDIEKHRTLDVTLFRKYFCDEEWNQMESAADKQAAFFEYWSVKESAIKCDGRGVEILSDTQVEKENIVRCAGNIFYYQLLPLEVHYACCVTADRPFHLQIKEVLWKELN